MKNSKLFQYIFIGAFVFFIVVGAILFATYKSADESISKINVTIWGTLPADSFTSFVAKYFDEKQIKYTVNYIARDKATFDRDLVEALASGTGPDAIVIPTDLIVRYTNKIYNIPYTVLSELTFKQTFIEEAELYLGNDGVIALPFTVDPLVMYWNRDIFNNTGVTNPPTTWAQISSLVSKMTTKDQAQNILRSTVAFGEFRNVKNAKEILSTLFLQAGSPIVSLNADGAFSSALKDSLNASVSPVISSVEFFANFSNSSKPQYSWNRSLPNSLDAFTNGDLAMYFGFASEYMTIKDKNPNLNFDVAMLPQGSGTKVVYGTFGKMLGFAIMKNSADPAGAYTAITALTSAEAFPYWTSVFNLPSARRDILGQVEKSAVKTVFNKSAIMSKGWYDPNTAETNIIFQNMIESYTTGRETIEGVVGTASDEIDNLLK